jgi:hypothetical protein
MAFIKGSNDRKEWEKLVTSNVMIEIKHKIKIINK